MAHDGLMHRVARGTAIVAILQVAGMALGYLAQVVLARLLGTYEYGIYRYAFSWITLIGTLACLGFPTALQRYIPQHAGDKQWGLLKGLILGSRLLVMGAGLLAAALAAAVFHQAAGRWLDPAQARALMIGAWIIPIFALFVLNTQLARSFHRMTVAFLPWNIGRPAAALLAAGSLYWLLEPTGLDALLAFGGCLAVFMLLQWAWVWRAYPEPARLAPTAWAWRPWLQVALPLLLMTGFGILLNQLGVLMVGSMLGPADAGIFAVATQLATLVSFFLGSINNVVAPRISELYHAGNNADLQRMLSTVVHWIFWPSLLVGLVLVVAARPILSLFGPDFAAGAAPSVLIILVAGNLVNAAAGSVGLIMNVTGHQNLNAVVYGSSAALNVLLNILLLPRYGVAGGAAAMTATMILWNVLLVWIVARRLRLHPSIFSAWRNHGRPGR
ncbi:MAG: flippase [Acidobacteriota bacterium]|nr:flippase [Acidobacteriota bacterium]